MQIFLSKISDKACVQGSTNDTNGIPISFKVSTNDTIGNTVVTTGNVSDGSPRGTIGYENVTSLYINRVCFIERCNLNVISSASTSGFHHGQSAYLSV